MVRFIGFVPELSMERLLQRALDLCLERGQRHVPELIEPLAQRTEAVWIDVVDAPRAIGTIRDQPGLLQDLEVL